MAQEKTPSSDEIQRALAPLRAQIDDFDNQIVKLLNQRAHVAQQVGAIKAEASMRAYVPERERQLLERLDAINEGPLPAESLRLIYKEIISASLALESPLEVAFLGPEATFTHQATKNFFGMSAKLAPCRTIPEVFAAVERGRSDYGVVPIENSTEGIVNHTLDSFMTSDLSICAEVLLEVNQTLLNRSGQLEGIVKVYSHPQALAQCRGWLTSHLPGVPLLDVSSTSYAAQLASEDDTAAAVASELAASMYRLQIAASNIQDLQGNLTRFLVIGNDRPARTGKDRTSIMFAVKDVPGILFEALRPLSEEGLNMSRIESRPSRRKAWDYMFFIDVTGHLDEENVARGIEGLKKTCEFFKVLGSYPQGNLENLRRRKATADLDITS